MTIIDQISGFPDQMQKKVNSTEMELQFLFIGVWSGIVVQYKQLVMCTQGERKNKTKEEGIL